MLVHFFLETNLWSIDALLKGSSLLDSVGIVDRLSNALGVKLIEHGLNLALLVVHLGLEVEPFKILEPPYLFVFWQFLELLKYLGLLLLALVLFLDVQVLHQIHWIKLMQVVVRVQVFDALVITGQL